MPPTSTARAALETLDRQLSEQAGPLVTEEQLQRILSVSAIQDPSERVARLNEIHDDLQRQVLEIEARWRGLESKLNRLNRKLPDDQQKLLDDAHAEMIAGIRTEAASLLTRDQFPAAAAVPRRLRMTI